MTSPTKRHAESSRLIECHDWTDRQRLFQSNLVCNTRLRLTCKKIYFTKMGLYIAGFICALVMAALVIAVIAYCMFVKERHKSEFCQYNISDLQHKNYLLSQEEPIKKEKKVSAGIFLLPSRRKQKEEEYNKRPDYPEGSMPISRPSTEKLIDILNESADVHYNDGIYEVDSSVPYHSDV